MFLYQQEYVNAFYAFLLAGLTDGIDGWLARHFHWQSFLVHSSIPWQTNCSLHRVLFHSLSSGNYLGGWLFWFSS
nr:CDP-alcohol phosphatidyltransferase family protein [Legionella tunisiensis]